MAAYLRLTSAAVDDLQALFKKGPQIVRQVLKKCLLLENDPYAGEPLLADLIGFRKLVVGDRNWRIVWRVLDNETLEVEIAEIWAVGARSDSEVYGEIKARIKDVSESPLTSRTLSAGSRPKPIHRQRRNPRGIRFPNGCVTACFTRPGCERISSKDSVALTPPTSGTDT